jgi:ribosomal protein S1
MAGKKEISALESGLESVLETDTNIDFEAVPETTPKAPDPILTLVAGAKIITQSEKDNIIWHEIKSSHITGSHLTGILGKVEQLDSGALISIVDYKGRRIAIPLKEMMLGLRRPTGQSDNEYNERAARILNRMMGAEIDFVVRGITGAAEERAAVASRRAAMLRQRQRYYFASGVNGRPQIYPGRITEARIVAVSQMAIRVEIFGAETSIRNRELSWGYVGDCRDDYFVGDSIRVRVMSVNGDAPENLEISASVKALTTDETRERLITLKPQTNCLGKVSDVKDGIIFINLIDGVRAIAHKCFDRRKPARGDDVMFVCTRIDEESGVALGIVPRIVRRNI